MTTKQSRPNLAGDRAAQGAFHAPRILSNADSWWRDCAERAMAWYIETSLPFTSDDLVDIGVPEADVAGRWGALFSAYHRRGLIELVGYQPSRRASRQGAPTRVWQGTAGVKS